MKKLFMFLLLGIFLISFASAINIDYSPNAEGVEDMKAHVEDTILFGLISIGEQGTLELKSHKSPQHVLKVGAGWQVTMIYDSNFEETQLNGLGNVTFIDMRTGEEVERSWRFVYWGEEQREREICLTYQTIENNTNSTNSTSYVECSEFGNEFYTYEGWLDYDSKDIPLGEITFGLMTYVFPNDYVDGIWEVYDEKIDKHASWTSDLNTDIVSYYKLDETTGVVVDSLGINNLTNNGATINQAGKIKKAYSFDGTNDYLSKSSSITNINSAKTYNLWIYTSNNDGGLISSRNGAYSNGDIFNIYQDKLSYSLGGVGTVNAANTTITNDAWIMVTLTTDTNNNDVRLYVNGNIVGIGSIGAGTGTSLFVIGEDRIDVHNQPFNGKIDEVGIWSRALSSEEITQLYNEGDGITYTNVFGNVTLLTPTNNAVLNNQEVNFSASVLIPDISNVTLKVYHLNDTLAYTSTNTSEIEGDYFWSEEFEDGEYYWNVFAINDFDDETSGDSNFTFTIDTTPDIQFVSPTPENGSSFNENFIPVNVTVTETYFENITFNFYKGGELNETITFTDDTRFYNKTGCTCDNWEFNVTVCTTTGKCNTTETREIFIDLIPPEINITSPNETFNYLKLGQEIYLNFTATDFGFAGLDSCWYNYNGTNVSVSCLNETLTSTNFSQEANNFNLTVYANDTLGNVGSAFTEWDYKLFESAIDYNPSTFEGSSETYNLTLIRNPLYSVSKVDLIYDGVEQSSGLFVSGNNVKAVTSLIPPSVENDTNRTFYFEVHLTNLEEYNSTSNVQLVKDFSLGNCSTYSNELLTLILKDEETFENLNGSIKAFFELLNENTFATITNFSAEFTDVNEQQICSSINLSETTALLNAEIRYEAENYSSEFYHIQRSSLDEYPSNITLYPLKDEDTTVFKITYQNSDLVGVEGAIVQLQRKIIEDGVFVLVEAPLTSSESTALLHIDTNTQKYQITLVKNGEVLGLFENLVFKCQSELTGECSLDLFESVVPQNLDNLNNKRDFSYLLSSGNNSIITTFTIPSGVSSEVRSVMTQKTIVGTNTVCNTSLISSAGSIECEYENSIQDSAINLKIYKDDILYSETSYKAKTDMLGDFGGNNYFIVFIMLMSLVFMALTSPEWMVINGIITFLLAGGLWLLNGLDFTVGIGGLIWIVIAGIIIIVKLSKQEDL